MKNDLERFSKGIHIEKLEKKDIKFILENYYNIKVYPEFDLDKKFYNNNFEETNLKLIYHKAVYTLLLNSYQIPINDFSPVNPLIFFNDMVMMLNLYVVNNKYLPSNQLPISTTLQTQVQIIEQSGFGEILGFRRENITNNDTTYNAEHRKHIIAKVILSAPSKEDNTTQNVVVRDTHTDKFRIPNICQNILIALLKSRKYNPYVFAYASESSNFEDEAINPLDGLRKSLIGDHKSNIDDPIDMFTPEIKEAIKVIAEKMPLVSSKLYDYVKDNDIKKYSKFYSTYYNNLENTWKTDQNEQYLEQTDLYLSELLFAHKYYFDTVNWLEDKFKNTNIDETVKENFLYLVYIVSESRLCFLREEHIKQYWELLFSSSQKLSKKKQLLKRIEKFKKIERNCIQKFSPALYYCFLYYTIDNINKIQSRSEPIQLVHEMKKIIFSFEENLKPLDQHQSKIFDSNENIKLLLLQRKRNFLLPLQYSYDKALF